MIYIQICFFGRYFKTWLGLKAAILPTPRVYWLAIGQTRHFTDYRVLPLCIFFNYFNVYTQIIWTCHFRIPRLGIKVCWNLNRCWLFALVGQHVLYCSFSYNCTFSLLLTLNIKPFFVGAWKRVSDMVLIPLLVWAAQASSVDFHLVKKYFCFSCSGLYDGIGESLPRIWFLIILLRNALFRLNDIAT